MITSKMMSAGVALFMYRMATYMYTSPKFVVWNVDRYVTCVNLIQPNSCDKTFIFQGYCSLKTLRRHSQSEAITSLRLDANKAFGVTTS